MIIPIVKVESLIVLWVCCNTSKITNFSDVQLFRKRFNDGQQQAWQKMLFQVGYFQSCMTSNYPELAKRASASLTTRCVLCCLYKCSTNLPEMLQIFHLLRSRMCCTPNVPSQIEKSSVSKMYLSKKQAFSCTLLFVSSWQHEMQQICLKEWLWSLCTLNYRADVFLGGCCSRETSLGGSLRGVDHFGRLTGLTYKVLKHVLCVSNNNICAAQDGNNRNNDTTLW